MPAHSWAILSGSRDASTPRPRHPSSGTSATSPDAWLDSLPECPPQTLWRRSRPQRIDGVYGIVGWAL